MNSNVVKGGANSRAISARLLYDDTVAYAFGILCNRAEELNNGSIWNEMEGVNLADFLVTEVKDINVDDIHDLVLES